MHSFSLSLGNLVVCFLGMHLFVVVAPEDRSKCTGYARLFDRQILLFRTLTNSSFKLAFSPRSIYPSFFIASIIQQARRILAQFIIYISFNLLINTLFTHNTAATVLPLRLRLNYLKCLLVYIKSHFL